MVYKIWYHWRGFDQYKTITAATAAQAVKKARLAGSIIGIEVIGSEKTPADVIAALLRDF